MSAIISPCGKYRYRLDRGPFDWQPGLVPEAARGSVDLAGKVIAFFGVTPSIR